MDQLISAGAKESHAMLLDCKTLDFEFIPIPENVSFIVMDTLTRRELTQSEYNTRHEEVQIVTSILGLNSLREANYSDLKAKEKEISPTLMKRANHVINENYRVLNFVEAMRRNNLISMGKLLNESHVSLRDDFEVSSEALNLLVDLANLRPNCYGARMTGAGFGGCALAMVKKGNEESFIQEVTAAYKKITGICPNLFTIQSVNGANSQKLK
jgi:galactokinase